MGSRGCLVWSTRLRKSGGPFCKWAKMAVVLGTSVHVQMAGQFGTDFGFRILDLVGFEAVGVAEQRAAKEAKEKES